MWLHFNRQRIKRQGGNDEDSCIRAAGGDHPHPRRTRLGNGAVGVYRDADAWMGNKAGEYEARMPSARSAQNFRRMAEQYRMQQGERNSRFEADQIKAYRDGEADATIRLGLDEIAESFDDDKAVEAARQQMMLALELKTRGMGTEARRAAYEAMEGQISMTRLARMIQKDPIKAPQWYSENKDKFQGLDHGKAEKMLEAGQERLWKDNAAALADAYLRGQFISREQIKQMVNTGQISPEIGMRWAETFENRNERLQARAERESERAFRNALRKAPPDLKEFMLLERNYGTRPEESKAALEKLLIDIDNGNAGVFDIMDLQGDGIIGERGARRAQKALSKHQAQADNLYNSARRTSRDALKKTLNALGIDNYDYLMEFDELADATVTPRDKVDDMARGILKRAIEDSGNWHRSFWTLGLTRTQTGQVYDTLLQKGVWSPPSAGKQLLSDPKVKKKENAMRQFAMPPK